MVVALVVAAERGFEGIVIQEDRAVHIVRPRDMNSDNLYSINRYRLHIIILEQINIDLVRVVCQVPEIGNEFIGISHTLNRKPLFYIRFFAMFLNT